MLKIKDNIDFAELYNYGFKFRAEDNHMVKKVYLNNDNDDKNFYKISMATRIIELSRLDGELDNTLFDLIKADLVEEVNKDV